MAMRTQRMIRNLPCCVRYDLQVCQMISDTSSIDLWAGRFFVWFAWMIAKIRPTKQIMIPKYMMDRPLIEPPKMLKETWLRSGSTMSASPAKAIGVMNRNIAMKANRLRLVIKLIYNLLTKILILI
jgi:hypothetical protein